LSPEHCAFRCYGHALVDRARYKGLSRTEPHPYLWPPGKLPLARHARRALAVSHEC
jgi:hypothetical protein